MRSTRRAAATILVVAITAFAAACAPMYAPDPAAVGANTAANWLVTQFDATTHLIPSAFVPGSPDPGASAYAATSLKITGVGGTTAADAVAALAPIVDLYVKDGGGNDKPGSLSRLILAIESIGAADPVKVLSNRVASEISAAMAGRPKAHIVPIRTGAKAKD